MASVSKQLKTAREAFVRRLLAKGLYDNDILDACEASRLFEVESPRRIAGEHRVPNKLLTRAGVKTYLCRVREGLRNTQFDGVAEIRAAYERLLYAFQIAATKKDCSGMIKAQRELTRLFGFGRVLPDNALVDINQLREQLAAMDLSIGQLS